MKVRIVERPKGYVYVEVRQWFRWVPVESFWGDTAWEQAKQYALVLIEPKFEYIK